MEALTAVSVAALTVYDMIKAVERGVVIGGIALLEKSGGKSGAWSRPEPRARIAGTPRLETGRTQPRAPLAGHPRFKPGTRSDQ
jgi:hypothetical protein